jgi:hypothetical protein
MAQITIYLPDEIEEKARQAAQTEGTSVSRWIAEQVVRNFVQKWPKAVLEAAGAFPDFPDVPAIRGGYGKDRRREPLR